jgi:ubiquinone/menaquinone biosynthesis C-methylase UbiE
MTMDDPTGFRQASRKIWDRMADGWETRSADFEVAARRVTTAMLEQLQPKPGQTILDLAAGTGLVGFAAATAVGGDGRVIVSDFAEQMVLAARRRADRLGLANVECRRLDAERLDLTDDAVDGVLCRWGYMLMGNPGLALGETRRVLRRGGTLVLSVFAGPDENPWASLPMQVLVQSGFVEPPTPGAPGILALGDRSRLRQLVVDAGFSEPHLEDVAFTWDFPDFDAYWTFLTDAAGAISMVIAALDDDQIRDVHQRLGRLIETFHTGDMIRLPATSVVASTFQA